MQLRNRLKKMEKQLITSGEVCACPDSPKFEFIDRRGETDTITNVVGASCEKCGKPLLIIHITSPEMRGEI